MAAWSWYGEGLLAIALRATTGRAHPARHCRHTRSVVPAHVAKSMGGAGIVTRSVRDEKHSTRLFLAHRTEGMGDAGRWSIEYLSRPEFKAWLCGESPAERVG